MLEISRDLISQSEVDTFLICERKHYYAYGERLQPKEFPTAISRGTLGHRALQTHYEGGNWRDYLNKFTIENPDSIEVVLEIKKIIPAYLNYYENDKDWEILTVEREFRLGNMPMQPDLVVREKSTGKIFVVDHKFLYNFYSNRLISMMPQLKKYMGALRLLGYPVDGYIYNMIRYRQNAKDKFYRHRNDNVHPKAVDRFIKEQDSAMKHIRIFKDLSLETWEDTALRTATVGNCKNCWFLDLCDHDLNGLYGRDLLVSSSYEPNTYGYMKEVTTNE